MSDSLSSAGRRPPAEYKVIHVGPYWVVYDEHEPNRHVPGATWFVSSHFVKADAVADANARNANARQPGQN